MFTPVKRPDNTKIHPQGNNRYVYVTLEKNYDPVKKFNVDKRKCIGKMIDDEMMMPNDFYYTYFKEDKPLENAPTISDTLSVGNYFLIKSIFEQLGLSTLLDSIYGDIGALIRDIAAYMIVEETSALQHYETYAFTHPVFSKRIYSDTRISEILHEPTLPTHDLFLERWNLMHTEVEDVYISYDSTNMNSAAKGIELLEYGHSKDESSELPQINMSIGFDQNSLTPLFYETYPGSVVDKSQCEMMIKKVRRYGYKNIGFILDRGYFTMENLRYFEKNNYNYIIMAMSNVKFVQPAIEETKYKVKKSQYYLPEYEIYGMTSEYRLKIDEETERYMHVYYNPANAVNETRAILNKFARYDKQLDKLVQSKTAMKITAEKYKKYYTLRYYQGYLIGYERKDSVIDKLVDNCGYFVIVTSKEMTATEALYKYRHRDTSEKLFMMGKSFLEADVIRTHHSESTETKEMINFIALIIRNRIFKEIKLLSFSDSKNYTTRAVIKELDKMIMTKDSSGRYSMRYAMTSKQKAIFSMFQINESKIQEMARNLSDSLFK